MAYQGPQKIPGATTGSSWYQDSYPGDRMEVNVGVIHTTEGTSLPTYGGGASAPNVTGVPDFANQKIKWYQHFDVDCSSRALVNQSGGVQTNTLNAFQVELVGTCDPATHKKWTDAGVKHIFWPEAPDWALVEVAWLVKWLYDNHGMQIRSTVIWKAYPASYGASAVRLTGSQWTSYYGWLGHQHVPENVHGDPGNINWKRIEELAKGAAPDTGGTTNVALSADDIKNIFYADLIPAQEPPYNNTDWESGNKTWTFKYAVYTTVRDGRDTNERVKGVEANLTTLSSQVAALTADVQTLKVGGVDLDALAEKVADLLAARLAN